MGSKDWCISFSCVNLTDSTIEHQFELFIFSFQKEAKSKAYGEKIVNLEGKIEVMYKKVEDNVEN